MEDRGIKAMKIYLASSWRNQYYPSHLDLLRSKGHEVYDFRNANSAFQWGEIDKNWNDWDTNDYINSLAHPVAQTGFATDHAAMEWAQCGILLLPCGRSAHLEAGYMIGSGKPVAIYIPSQRTEPELMYALASIVTNELHSLFEWLDKLDRSPAIPRKASD